MWKIVIVDDEYIVVEGIKAIIERESLNFEVAGCAYDGIEGARIIEEIRPDLVIADVRMPGKTGLEMIKELSRKEVDTEFLIISGYREFEYARTALQLGVRGYIDKPLTIDSIKETLESMEKILREKENQSRVFARRKGRMEYEKESDRLIQMIAAKECDGGTEQLEKVLKSLKTYKENIGEYREEGFKLVCLAMGVFWEIKDNKNGQNHMPSYENIRYVEKYEEMDLFIREIFSSIFYKIKAMKIGSTHKTVEKIIRYLDENYDRDIGLADVAELADMNYVYLSILFKEQIGMSFVKYLTDIRMEHAKQFLEQGEKIGKVAELVGYSNYRYFCDIFKKHEGMTPSEYRGNVRKIKET